MSLYNPNRVNPQRPKRIALVIANPATSSSTGWPVGFWWSEVTHPYYVLTEAGYEVTFFSPDGGACVADALSDPNDASGYSRHDLISQGFLHTPELLARIANTTPVQDLVSADYDALLVAGGQAPMFNFANAHALQQQFAAFHAAGKVVAALCHGVALLAFTQTTTGEYLASGKTITGFSNQEEDQADQAAWHYGWLPSGQSIMPWRIETRLQEIGANFVHAGAWQSYAVRDGNLITGQQNFSGEATARLMIEALGR
ncbi:type 1 glutamine amidotransferase domain-containing protein [Chitinibacter sp. ZOR0017]|uniref:type 1 glutamine amidotransferase domain-containing protein n=1 Tax=Chitinibacter sp. ZOR0017 TaxID=1339254 RepID=UPI000647C6F3|nr:type 1 glutamine amidotransferase domain-containing protein [Chitinibacter sp. ZOR0017]